MTPQPVPQKRHGALAHLRSAAAASVTTFCAAAIAGGSETAVAAPATVELRRNARREVFMASSKRGWMPSMPVLARVVSRLRRSGDQLIHPDGEAVTGDDQHREHGCHDDGEEQEASQLLAARGRGLCHRSGQVNRKRTT